MVAADSDTDGIAIAANALALNSGTIQDSGDTNAVITHSALAASANHKVNAVADADTAPSFGSSTIANQSLIQNSAMTSVTLPAATGGNGTLSYSISPALPAGLTFTASTRVLSGTPTGTSASATYTYTVTDGDNNTASTDKDTLTFTIAVAAEADTAPSFGSSTIANQSLIQNSAMTSLTLPAATGSNGTLTYSLTPALPTGLTFTASTRVLSGTPTGTSASATYTYTVTDGDSDTATLTFTIVVAAEDTAPSFADNASIANQSLTQNSAMTSVTLPAATGGNGTLSYSISPSLPAGLSFTASTRVLSGTPTGTSASATYTYTVSDGDNNTDDTDKDTLTFTIVVAAEPDTAPAFADNASIANQSLTQNTAMTDLTLPAATGGNGTLSYTITPTLPAGLTFTASTRVLSGTPSASAASATYTYTVSDGDNNSADTDEDTITFTIVVAADTVVGAPGAPTGFTATPVKEGVALKASATGSNITKWQYRFKRSTQDDSKYRPWRDLPSSASNSIADKKVSVGNKAGDLRLGGTYVFQVRAVNSNGNGATSIASAAVTPLANDHVYFATGNTVTMKEGGAVSKQVRLAEPLTGTDTVTLTFTETSSKITIDTDPSTAGDQTELTYTASNWNRGQSLYVYSAGGTGTATVSVEVKTGSKASYIGKTATLNVTVSGTAPAKPQAKARLDHASDSGTYIVVQIADTKAAGDAGNGWALDPVQAASGRACRSPSMTPAGC